MGFWQWAFGRGVLDLVSCWLWAFGFGGLLVVGFWWWAFGGEHIFGGQIALLRIVEDLPLCTESRHFLRFWQRVNFPKWTKLN